MWGCVHTLRMTVISVDTEAAAVTVLLFADSALASANECNDDNNRLCMAGSWASSICLSAAIIVSG